jgi:hypothetical protein
MVMLAAVAVLWLMAYPTKTGFRNDARQEQGSVNLTATTFRHSIAY